MLAPAPLHLGGPVRCGPNEERPRMRLIAWKPLVKNSLREFATIELSIGLKIFNILTLISNGNSWATLPGKPILDADGKPAGWPTVHTVVDVVR